VSSAAEVYLVVAQADAAFGIKALSCGVDYGAANLFVSWTFCADGLEFPAGSWPAPGGGNRMTWETCQNSTIGSDGVHAVAGVFYVYAYSEDRFEITRHNLIFPPELQVVDCSSGVTDLPDSALSSVFMGTSEQGVNPCGEPSPTTVVQRFAVSDIPVSGTVSGSYLDTHLSDGVYEALTERESGGRKSNRYSFGEHKWDFDVAAGTAVTLKVEAYRPDNTDGDDFRFEYSTDNVSFTPVLTVGSSVEQVYSASLPASLSGMVYIRVVDTDQTPGNRSLDSININHLYIETETSPPTNPPVADFIGTPTSGNAPLAVSFTDQSTENPTSWSWDFGDLGTSTLQNPSHTYSAEGTYTVSLTATNSVGSDTETKVDYITVTTSTGPVIHVGDMVVTRVTQGPWFRGSADVTVVDAGGAPVANATVTGFFNAPNEDSKSAVSGADGVATVRSDKTKSPPTNWCFQVSDITLSGATYDPSANVWLERCEDGSGIMPNVSLPLSSDSGVIRETGFSRNYPNPLSLATSISFDVATSDHVRLEIFDVVGRRVAVLADAVFGVGRYDLIWDASGEPSGVYFYRLAVGDQVQARKMLVVR
jgi:PKD repeat protein